MRQRLSVNVRCFLLSGVLTVQLIDPSAHHQHGQCQSQATVHGDALPRVWDVNQALDGQDPIVRHYRRTQTQPHAVPARRLRSVCRKRRVFLLRPCDSCGVKALTRVQKIKVFRLMQTSKQTDKVTGILGGPEPKFQHQTYLKRQCVCVCGRWFLCCLRLHTLCTHSAACYAAPD